MLGIGYVGYKDMLCYVYAMYMLCMMICYVMYKDMLCIRIGYV